MLTECSSGENLELFSSDSVTRVNDSTRPSHVFSDSNSTRVRLKKDDSTRVAFFTE